MKVKVSIIIPMFNSGAFIIEMIECIINQTFSNWELIIVDDISTDGTFDTVEEYTRNEDRVKLIQRNRLPKGAQTCRNIGFQSSIGDYVLFFDADDLISKSCVKQRVQFMNDNPQLDFGIFPAHTINNSNEIFNLDGKRIYSRHKQKDDFSSLLKGEVPMAVWTNIYKRKAIVEIRWDEEVEVFQDFYFNFLVITNNLKFEYSLNAEFDYFYRVNANVNSITSNFIKNYKVKSTIYLFSSVLESIKLREDFLERKKDLFRFCLIYFEKLLSNSNEDVLELYMVFLKKNYKSKYYVLNKTISNVRFFRNDNLRKISLFLSMIILFKSEKHLLILVKKFKVW